MKVTKRVEFCYGHMLPNHPGKCRNPHGHSAILEVTVEGYVVEETGMVIDFADLKEGINGVVNAYDHAWIMGTHEPAEFVKMFDDFDWRWTYVDGEATAENIAVAIKEGIQEIINFQQVFDVKVKLYESSSSWVEV